MHPLLTQHCVLLHRRRLPQGRIRGGVAPRTAAVRNARAVRTRPEGNACGAEDLAELPDDTFEGEHVSARRVGDACVHGPPAGPVYAADAFGE